jgi:hypothetical protein
MSGIVSSSLVGHAGDDQAASPKAASWFATDEAGGRSNFVLTGEGDTRAYGVETNVTEDLVNVVLTTGDVLAITPDYGVVIQSGATRILVRAEHLAVGDHLVGGTEVANVQRVHAVGGWQVSHLLVEQARPYAAQVGDSLVYVQRPDKVEVAEPAASESAEADPESETPQDADNIVSSITSTSV